MSVPAYSIGYASTGRSKCKGSGEVIPKGVLRVAKITEQNRGGDEPIMMTAWHLPLPFFQMMKRMRNKELVLKSTTDLAGFHDLTAEDQAAFEQQLIDFHDPHRAADSDFPPKEEKKPKKKEEDGEGDDEAEGKPAKKAKKAPRPPIPDEVREGVDDKEALKALATELVTRCRDRGLQLPSDDAAACKNLGPLVLSNKKGSTVDVAAVIEAAEAQFGVAKVIDVACEANHGLVKAFSELTDHEFKKKDTMKALAYKKVVAALQKHDVPITSGKEAQKLTGIGKSSGAKIDEYLNTGAIAVLEEYKNAS